MPRIVRVSTTSGARSPGGTHQANVEHARGLLELACCDRPDIVCLPEAWPSRGLSKGAQYATGEPVPGPATDMACTVAKAHNTYVICPLRETRGERIFNVCVLIDRRGSIVGTYEKIHPVSSTDDFTVLEDGVTPGREAKVFDTDFGRIGMLICFDANWPAEWAELKRRGAEIVFWASAYPGGYFLNTYAAYHRYYVVSSTWPVGARIIDLTGKLLGETSPSCEAVCREIDLDKQVFHLDFNASQIAAIRQAYGPDVLMEIDQATAIMTLRCLREGLSVAEVAKRFGLMTFDEYVRVSTIAQDALRAGEPAPAQDTPVKGHVQYI